MSCDFYVYFGFFFWLNELIMMINNSYGFLCGLFEKGRLVCVCGSC